MAWNVTVPADTDAVNLGAGVIRQLKVDLAAALSVEGIFPADTLGGSAMLYRWKPRIGTTGDRPACDATQPGSIYLNTDTSTIQRDNGTTWDDVTFNAGSIPSSPDRGAQAFSATTTTFTVPAGVYSIYCKVWGAGGGGSGYTGIGGGGGGGYSEGVLAVTPGQVVAVLAGVGGAGGYLSGSYYAGAAGSTSSVAATIIATGGAGGTYDGGDGAGGSGSGGMINLNGMPGGVVGGVTGTVSNGSTPGAGHGGVAPLTEYTGAAPAAGYGVNGLAVGGGGSAAASNGPSRTGGIGGAGLVIISW